MLEIGNTLRVFAPGVGTFKIEVTSVSHPIGVYIVWAKDYRGGYYEYINEWRWRGPKNEIYYVLDAENNILDPKMRESYTRK